jgi:NADH-quinone oxidoreductase subunit M
VLITGALFLLVGVIYERTHDRTIAKMGGLAGLTPIYAAVFGFFVFASAGLPGLSGFIGEFLVLVGSFAFAPLVATIAAFVMILGAAYLLWMFQRVVTGEPSEFIRGLGHHITDMTPIEIVTIAPLAALVVVFGILPGLLLDVVQPSVDSVLEAVAAGAPVALGPIVPAAALGVIGLLLAARLVVAATRRDPSREVALSPGEAG